MCNNHASKNKSLPAKHPKFKNIFKSKYIIKCKYVEYVIKLSCHWWFLPGRFMCFPFSSPCKFDELFLVLFVLELWSVIKVPLSGLDIHLLINTTEQNIPNNLFPQTLISFCSLEDGRIDSQLLIKCICCIYNVFACFFYWFFLSE